MPVERKGQILMEKLKETMTLKLKNEYCIHYLGNLRVQKDLSKYNVQGMDVERRYRFLQILYYTIKN